jgi:acetyl-CoA acetyltransferase family protein
MRRAVLVDVVRSPFGKGRESGALAGVHPVDLLATVIRALVERTGVDPAAIDDVIMGCALPVGEQSGNVARHALLAAGLPESVPGVSIDRKCGSADQAVHFAVHGVQAGAYDAVIAGGVEMMGVVPMRANRLGRDEYGSLFREVYPDGWVPQGVAAELIAARWNLDRDDLDSYALESHRRAARARAAGWTARDIVPVRGVDTDEGIRADTSLARLGALPPAFHRPEFAARFPELGWHVTAGNSSQLSDGASAVLVVGEDVAERWGLRPRAAVRATSVVGSDPLLMLTGVIPATHDVLERAGLGLDDIATFEVNEAFASVVLAWRAEFGVDPARVNSDGGAVALGHPIAASGGRLLATLLGRLERIGGRYGLQAVCESGGMANATVVERL